MLYISAMDNFSDEKYFFWGAASEIQFGLYSAVLDRFVIVDGSEQADLRLHDVAFLLSAKVELFVVPLHLAPNFEPNLIDNQCCEHWHITDWSAARLSPGYFRNIHHHTLSCCGTLEPIYTEQDIDDLQRLAWLAYWVVNLFKFNPNLFYTRYHDMLTMPFNGNQSYLAQIKQKERDCFDSIYRSDCYKATQMIIEKIVEQNVIDSVSNLI